MLSDGDWQRLADHIRAELRRRGWTQRDLAHATGVSLNTISTLVNGHSRSRMPSVVPAVEEALGWAPGSARLVLEGGDPIRDDDAPPQAPRAKSTRSFWSLTRKLDSTVGALAIESLRLSDAFQALSPAELGDALRTVRELHERASAATQLLGTIRGNLEDWLSRVGRNVTVDNKPLTATERTVYRAMLAAHGEDVAVDAVRSLRKARESGHDEAPRSIGSQRRAPDISQIRPALGLDADDDEANEATP